MIKNLKKSYVITSMSAVGILIIVLIGLLNVANAVFTARQELTRLNMIAEIDKNDFDPGMRGGEPPVDEAASEGEGAFAPEDGQDFRGRFDDGGRRFFDPEPNENDRISSVWFSASADADGSVTGVNVTRINTVTEEEAAAIAAARIAAGETQGRTGDFRFISVRDGETGDSVYYFLDVSSGRSSVFRVAVFSVAAGVLVWALMLPVVIAISGRAVKPIEENYEKQRQFITDAGHELKTPLAVILSNTEAMEMINGENKWTRNIRLQTDRLSSLMQSLLTLARADEGKVKLVASRFDLSALVGEECAIFEQGAANKNARIDAAVTAGLEYEGDREQIRRLVSILLDNAVKYCREGSEIRVSLTAEDKKLRLTTSNECDSLPDCPPDKLFDRFYRPDGSRSRATGGNGIGLSAAKSIARLHGGRISAVYKDGRTIEFTVEL